MLSNTRWFVALHLLCISSTVRPLVLLTANVDDIKKIARKFISENLADKIADLLAKAGAGDSDTKISAENDENADAIQMTSSEKKIVRAGKKINKETKHDDGKNNEKNRAPKEPTAIDDEWLSGIFKTAADFQFEETKRPKANSHVKRPSKRKAKRLRNVNEIEDRDTTGAVPQETNGIGPYVEDEAMNYPKEARAESPKVELVATSGPVVLPKVYESMW